MYPKLNVSRPAIIASPRSSFATSKLIFYKLFLYVKIFIAALYSFTYQESLRIVHLHFTHFIHFPIHIHMITVFHIHSFAIFHHHHFAIFHHYTISPFHSFFRIHFIHLVHLFVVLCKSARAK